MNPTRPLSDAPRNSLGVMGVNKPGPRVGVSLVTRRWEEDRPELLSPLPTACGQGMSRRTSYAHIWYSEPSVWAPALGSETHIRSRTSFWKSYQVVIPNQLGFEIANHLQYRWTKDLFPPMVKNQTLKNFSQTLKNYQSMCTNREH